MSVWILKVCGGIVRKIKSMIIRPHWGKKLIKNSKDQVLQINLHNKLKI
jgi:hypothetical protein